MPSVQYVVRFKDKDESEGIIRARTLEQAKDIFASYSNAFSQIYFIPVYGPVLHP